MRRVWVAIFALCVAALGKSPNFSKAEGLYHRTEYQAALNLLLPEAQKDGADWALIGKSYFMMADYKKANESFEKALAAEPGNSEYHHWMGRTWGRRAETSTAFLAPTFASRARQSFEHAVTLDPHNEEALNDLFDYYLQAPGFLGGGLSKAQALADRIGRVNAAEGHYAQAQLADKRKEFDAAEQQLRRALEMAPRQVGRVLDLAKYLSKRGRVQESELAFAEAEKLAPDSPRVLYERAQTYIRDKRNLDQARALLKKYITCSLTPDDPPRERAEELLKKVSGA
jgi:cytochrome c-type biogenesis protein CcmH/NrfG